MTVEQKLWLEANPEYRPVPSQTCGFHRYTRRGTLRTDGTFVRATKATPANSRDGAFVVGVLEDFTPANVRARS